MLSSFVLELVMPLENPKKKKLVKLDLPLWVNFLFLPYSILNVQIQLSELRLSWETPDLLSLLNVPKDANKLLESSKEPVFLETIQVSVCQLFTVESSKTKTEDIS